MDYTLQTANYTLQTSDSLKCIIDRMKCIIDSLKCIIEFAFWPIHEQRLPPWPLWFTETLSTSPLQRLVIDFNETGRKQVLHFLFPVVDFRADPSTNIATLASDLPRHLRLLLYNFDNIWQKPSTQRSLPSLCFSCWFVI